MEDKSLFAGSATISGIKWNAINQFTSQVFVLIGSIVISRILMPEVFGLFAMISLLTNCLALVIGLGFGQAIIQNRILSDDDLTSLFWTNVFAGGLAGLLLSASAPWVADFFSQPALTQIIWVMSPVLLVCAAVTVPLAILYRKLEFKKIALSEIIAAAGSYSGAILLAVKGFGIWALCFQYFSFYGIKLIVYFVYVNWLPSFQWHLDSLRKVFTFSRSLLPSQVLSYLTGNMDLFVAGKVFGKTELGLYGRANGLMMLPLNSLSVLVATTYFSIFSTLQNNKEELLRKYTECVKLVLIMLGVLLLSLMIVSYEFVYVVFGDAWTDAVPMLRILCLAGLIGGFSSTNDALLISQGATKSLLRITILEKTIFILSVLVGVFYGIIGLCWAKVAAQGASLMIRLYYQHMAIPGTILHWMTSFLKIGVALGVMCTCALVTRMLLLGTGPFAVLVLTSLVGALSVSLSLLVLREPVALRFKSYVMDRLQSQ